MSKSKTKPFGIVDLRGESEETGLVHIRSGDRKPVTVSTDTGVDLLDDPRGTLTWGIVSCPATGVY